MLMPVLRLVLVAACGGFASYWDVRTHTIPDIAWVGGLLGAALLALLGGPAARCSALAGATTPAVALGPGLLIRRGGRPLVPVADWCLATALGGLAGLAAPWALGLVALGGFLYALMCLARGITADGSPREALRAAPPYAPVLAGAFLVATAFPMLR